MKAKLLQFFKGETVLCISALCAAVSACFVRPSAAYLDYIDIRILCLLFCLMALISGFQKCGVFRLLAQSLLSRQKTVRGLAAVLILLPFFCSMLITNDVALITFVPFALLVLQLSGHMEHAPLIIVLQTVAANLGSMTMPFGNPQNLFLYGNYGLSAGDFFSVMVPLALASLICLALCSLLIKKEPVSVHFTAQESLQYPWLFFLCGVLFLMSLLSVFHVVHYALTSVLVAVFLGLLSRDLLKQVDYGLLLTFVCFFIFAGNIGEIPVIRQALSQVMEKSALFTSILASQVISNVPAAVLLSGFSDNWRDLLAGTNIGGLGTPIASLASLISLKLYIKSETARPGTYLSLFAAANLTGLLLLTGLYLLMF